MIQANLTKRTFLLTIFLNFSWRMWAFSISGTIPYNCVGFGSSKKDISLHRFQTENNNVEMENPQSSTNLSSDGYLNENENNNNVAKTNMLKANRFHKLAPDANLPTDEFRIQLRENMKADLEERRKNDPNRGNQPAKNYLDSL
mmetsp:Transcript_10495/g.14819  ORF Transcript_10495/g.14819 Transcript_10495/m.14819 type:complete len:144 (+) Transcript_10495:34-465(+)